jgi:hypothetical protein
MTARNLGPPGNGAAPRSNDREGGEVEALGGGYDVSTLPPAPDKTPRPRCDVVGVYCEALWWLRRESRCHATSCCRHFWGDDQAVASW